MEILTPKKNIILDATVFSTFMSCGRLTDFRFNQDLVSINGKANAIEVGLVFHKILEIFFKKRIAGIPSKQASDEAIEEGTTYYMTEDFPNLPSENTIGENGHIKDVGFNYLRDTLNQYFDHYKNDSWIPINAECVKQELIYEDDECRIIWKAKFDLIVDTNNGIYSVDHKTMKQRRDTLELNNQFMGQCLLMKTRSVIINKIGFQKTLKPSEKFTRPLVNYSLSTLTEWSQIIVPFWAKQMLAFAEIGYWPPNFSHCENKYGMCAFLPVCRSEPNMREETLRLHFIKGDKWDVTNEPD